MAACASIIASSIPVYFIFRITRLIIIIIIIIIIKLYVNSHDFLNILRRKHTFYFRMEVKEIGVNARNWVDKGLLESPSECGVELPGFRNDEVSYL